MEEKLENLSINSNLCSYSGIIGRRDFTLNLVYISLISMVVSIPFMFWIMYNASEFTDMFKYSTMFNNMPILFKTWTLIVTAAILPITISNVIRRLNDLLGTINKPLNIFAAVFYALSAFAIYIFPFVIFVITAFLSFIFSTILIFTPGKITSKMPYDVTKIFNWGAFLGTWIWGLFNKSYIPLWYLLIFFTPANFYFQLICGLKGNEWAFKKFSSEDYVEFNRKQERQATIWTILTFVCIPLLYFIIFFMLIFGVAMLAANNPSPDTPNKSVDSLEKIFDGFTSLYFKSHEITDTENKFYVDPSDWSFSTFSDKKDMLDLAATTAANERRKMSQNSDTRFSKTTELYRTKIYNSENGELLGEFTLDESAYTNGSFKEMIKATLSAYKFYKPTNNNE